MRRCRTVVGGNGISVISYLYYMHLEKKKELLSYDIMLLNLMAVLQINPPAEYSRYYRTYGVFTDYTKLFHNKKYFPANLRSSVIIHINGPKIIIFCS